MSLENEFRQMLRAKATVAPSPRPRASVIATARRRRIRRSFTVAVPIAAALSAVTVLAGQPTGDQRAYAAFRVTQKALVHSDAPKPHQHAAPRQPITRAMLEKNVECMRGHGFDLPDPVETSDGWQVIVEDSRPLPSESPDPNLRKRWAEAVFVECRLIDLSGDLVLGGRTRAQIERLTSCARERGFVLPAPKETRPGEFIFDLDAASPQWGSEAWYRTVFVTCGLWRGNS
jgi:hypothetical protein